MKEIRSKPFGHDLVALLAECQTERLSEAVEVGAEDHAVIGILNERYAAKRFDYGEVGAYQLPQNRDVAEIACRLATSLESVIMPLRQQ